ncbi:MAG: hypothetical protein ACLPX9_04660 [Rhodomicrobium sp.]
MKPIAPSPALRAVAERVVWFKEPDEALASPVHFLAHVMTYGTPEDLAVVAKAVPRDAFREVLDNPPPGIFDARSWAYWNLAVANISPAPPMPVRAGLQALCSDV